MKNCGMKKRVRSAACAALSGIALAALSVSPPVRASVRIEAVGAVLLEENASARQLEAARGEAFQRAIWEAVLRVAERLQEEDRVAKAARAAEAAATQPSEPENEEVPAEALTGEGEGESTAPVSREALREALGDRPRRFTSRYRLMDDRGVRPRMFVPASEEGGDFEYLVVAEVDVDDGRVRSTLEGAGIIDPPQALTATTDTEQIRVVLWDLPGYSAYQAVKTTLAEGRAPGAVVPIEFEPGRAVLGVNADIEPQRLARELIRTLPDELRVAGAVVEGHEVGLRIEYVPPIILDEQGEPRDAGGD